MTMYSSDSGLDAVSHKFNQMVELYNEAKEMREINASLAIGIVKRALIIANKLVNREYQYLCNYLLGRCQTLQGDFNNSLHSLSDSLTIARRSFPQDYNKLSLATNSIGLLYLQKDNRELSLDYFIKALEFNVKEDKLEIYNNIGSTYALGENYKKALEYFELALNEAKDSNDYFMQTALFLNISGTLLFLENIPLAKEKALKALSLLDLYADKESRYSRLKIRSLLNLGEIYIKEGDDDKGVELIDESMNLADEKSDFVNYCKGLRLKTIRYLRKEEEEEAILYLKETLDFAAKYQLNRESSDVLKQTIQYYENKGDYNKAYPLLMQLQKETELKVSQSREDNIKRIKSERKKEIKLLEDKNKEIQEQNLLLEQFAHIISHDLKEPIRNIVSFSSLLNKRYYHLLDEDGRGFLKYVIKGATTMDQNLTRLLDFTSLKIVKDEDLQKIYFSSIIKKINRSYKGAIEPYEVDITYPDNHFYMVYNHAYALFDEIISNVIKFRKKGMNCYVEINNTIEDNYHHISVKDYGIGIESEFKKQIFRIFNRLNKKDYDGSGVGLAICQRIINLYNGDIWIDSEPGIFTTVHIKIPLLVEDSSDYT